MPRPDNNINTYGKTFASVQLTPNSKNKVSIKSKKKRAEALELSVNQ